jgi:transcriptional regulator with XRE-family HTH domain
MKLVAQVQMERRKQTSLNLKRICVEYGVKYSDIAKRAGITRSYLSLVCNCRCSISEKVADIIVSAFPEVRKDFVLGYDAYMTKQEKDESVMRLSAAGNVADKFLSYEMLLCDVDPRTVPEETFKAFRDEIERFAQSKIFREMERIEVKE